MANQKLASWIALSVQKYLKQQANGVLAVAVIPLDRITESFVSNNPHRAEFTLIGPSVRELSADYWQVDLRVFCTLISNAGARDSGADHFLHSGRVQSWLDTCIPIYKLGTGENGDEIGHLEVTPGPTDRVSIRNLRPGNNDDLTHSVIESQHVGYFSEG